MLIRRHSRLVALLISSIPESAQPVISFAHTCDIPSLVNESYNETTTTLSAAARIALTEMAGFQEEQSRRFFKFKEKLCR